VRPTTSSSSRGYFSSHLFGFLEGVGFLEVAPHDGCDDRQQGADHERNPPTPVFQFLRREKHFLQEQQHDDRGELAADQGDVLKA
jgi:hypothetical protein